MKKSKYRSQKITRDGLTFDSLKEYRRFCDLLLLEKVGAITDLKRQVAFELIPAQYEEIPTGEFYKRGDRKGQPKFKRVCIEQSVFITLILHTQRTEKPLWKIQNHPQQKQKITYLKEK